MKRLNMAQAVTGLNCGTCIIVIIVIIIIIIIIIFIIIIIMKINCLAEKNISNNAIYNYITS